MLVYWWPWGQRLNLKGRRILYLGEWRTDKKTWNHCALCVEAPIWMIHLGFIIQPKFQDLREAYRFDEGSLEILGSCVTVWTMHRLKAMPVMDSNVFFQVLRGLQVLRDSPDKPFSSESLHQGTFVSMVGKRYAKSLWQLPSERLHCTRKRGSYCVLL